MINVKHMIQLTIKRKLLNINGMRVILHYTDSKQRCEVNIIRYPNEKNLVIHTVKEICVNDYFMFLLPLGGKGTIKGGIGENILSKGNVYIIPPNYKYVLDLQPDFKCIMIIFYEDVFINGSYGKAYSRALVDLNAITDSLFVCSFNSDTWEKLHQIILEIEIETGNKKSEYAHEEYIAILLKQFLIYCRRYALWSSEKVVPKLERDNYQAFINVVNMNYKLTHKVADYVNLTNISHYELLKCTRMCAQTTPLQIINGRIVQEAKLLVVNYNYRINEIANMLGFTDEHHFVKLFKKMVGLSPTRYRCQYRNNQSR